MSCLGLFQWRTLAMLAGMTLKVFKDRVALVTGASSGMGVEFARQLAQRGARLVIVARSVDKLEALAPELEGLSGHSVCVIGADLSNSEGVAHVVNRLHEEGLEVEHLVNNAGVGRAQSVAKDDVQALSKLVYLNCTAVTELTAHLLPGMISRASGGVLQVASVLSFNASPYMATYAASKAYVKSFTEGLAIELEGSGVTTTAVCPGHVQTGFQVAAGFGSSEMPVPGELSAEKTVRLGLCAYEKGKTVVVTGFMNRLSVVMSSLIPRSWVARISANVLRKMGRFD